MCVALQRHEQRKMSAVSGGRPCELTAKLLCQRRDYARAKPLACCWIKMNGETNTIVAHRYQHIVGFHLNNFHED